MRGRRRVRHRFRRHRSCVPSAFQRLRSYTGFRIRDTRSALRNVRECLPSSLAQGGREETVKFIVVIAAATLCYVASAHEPRRRPDVLKITIYDWANIPRAILLDAVKQLRFIFRQASIGVDVAVGDPDAEDATLFTYVPWPPMGQAKEAACQALRDLRVKIAGSSPAGLNNTVLGMASPFARTGLNVRLFSDHIGQAADRHGNRYATVLAYAMAHEIGHVLLRSGGHRARGIMSAVWTSYEYSQMDRGGLLLFTGDEVKEILQNAGGSGCPAQGTASETATIRSLARSRQRPNAIP
jgi:hypothetical protein